MRFRLNRRLLVDKVSRPRSLGRWALVVLGIVVTVSALGGAADPYRELREFGRAMTCEEGAGACLPAEQGSIALLDTFTRTSTDSTGKTSTTTHYKATWRRADGSLQAREIPRSFYNELERGEAATLRIWRGDVVGVEAARGTHWFLPQPAKMVTLWLVLAHLGLGILLWGLLFGWWDGPLLFVFRLCAWPALSIAPFMMTTDVLAYGLNAGVGFAIKATVSALLAVLLLWALLHTLDERHPATKSSKPKPKPSKRPHRR